MDELHQAITDCINDHLEGFGDIEITEEMERKIVREVYPQVSKLMNSLVSEKLKAK